MHALRSRSFTHCRTRVHLRSLVFQASDLKHVLFKTSDRTDFTRTAFEGAPLSMLPPGSRGHVLAEVARAVDGELHPQSMLEDALPGLCIDGSKRGAGRADHDWCRDGQRIECKSAKMSWRHHKRQWYFQFPGVKIAHDHVRKEAAFDELILMLYTPTHLYFYRHDGMLAMSSTGKCTASSGHVIYLNGSSGVEDWLLSLDSILHKLDDDKNGCSRLAVMRLTDGRIDSILKQRCNMTQQVFRGVPLSEISPGQRGARIEMLARYIDGIANPGAEIKLPTPGHCIDGIRRRAAHQSAFDWLRDTSRVECESAQLLWERRSRCWQFTFRNIKFSESEQFDELFLALYTPRGIHIYRHDQQLHVSRRGVATNVSGHQLRIRGPSDETNWVAALSAILRKLDDSDCDFIAFVEW